MSDPFDFLNPIASTKTPAEKALSEPHHAPVGVPPAPVAPINVGMGMPPHGNMSMGMAPPPAFNGGGMNMNMNMNMGGMPPPGGMMPGQFPGAPGMGMGMGPGMMQPMNPFGQQPPQQAPVMYDNIKKLLEKKPVVDDASMDFLEGIGDSGGAKVNSNPSMEPVRTPEPVANPFGAPQAPASDVDFSFLGGGGGAPPVAQSTAPSSGSKSSALASRLAHGKRPTQEAARKNLGFNAGAFAGTGHTAKISLKSVAGGDSAPTSVTSEPTTVDDFVAGSASLAPVDDIFAAAPTNPPANPASTSNDIFW
ncbi:hypothetical protein PHYSODRAFT_489741 [Phytophthora sojae]|uniref:Uncharacterized protein n=1 Tax=Phytophthora sojae (strain P6497) TaxID=1094619 RepID=G4Z263_PHYSP|nr:hypothetical protein PHYSODRAFT_489741 [Phytophthora sojae]EGZ21398.1 hypothetical protein PHYSODRAFT_489741 [Phytophthora sojae]|eukprot:XP_009524115.1 hypothetical protein PHYSODRAFT_489741 [Phytophthora sojae]